MKQTKTELIENIRDILSVLQAKYTNAQTDEKLLQIATDHIIHEYCTGQYVEIKKI